MRARDAARAQIVGVGLTLLLVDSAGRRPLMLCGSAACTGALLLLAAGDWRGSPALMLAAMCLFLLAFSASYAGLFWILCSELFSMQVKASAASAATAMLFAGGARPGTGSCCAQAHGVGRRTCCPCPPAQEIQSACRAPVTRDRSRASGRRRLRGAAPRRRGRGPGLPVGPLRAGRRLVLGVWRGGGGGRRLLLGSPAGDKGALPRRSAGPACRAQAPAGRSRRAGRRRRRCRRRRRRPDGFIPRPLGRRCGLRCSRRMQSTLWLLQRHLC